MPIVIPDISNNDPGTPTWANLVGDSIEALDAAINNGDWFPITGSYNTGYSAYNLTVLYTPAFQILPAGWIGLRGRIVADGSITAETVVSGIPTAMRPQREVRINVLSSTGDNTGLTITPAGVISNAWSLSASWLSLDGMRYYAGAN